MIINNVKVAVGCTDKQAIDKAIKKSGVSFREVKTARILKKSLDARDKSDLHYVYTVAVNEEEKRIEYPLIDKKIDVVIIGDGPAGLFCALTLSRMGFCPTVIERGEQAFLREKKCNDFYKSGVLDEESNVQFGEGGAGTFSDGKLNTGIKSEYIKQVLKDFVKHGAKEEILYSNKPHIGSDVLPKVVTSVREEIENSGGKFLFNTLFERLVLSGDRVKGVLTNKGEIQADVVILALGHSAENTFLTLHGQGVVIENKPFAVGVRIEHLREDVNSWQYGKNYDKRLPTADYKLTSSVNGKGVFTFCMCPGGYVMPATSVQNGVVCNGMSLNARDAENSNSAVIVQVDETDFGTELFSGMKFQRELERKAYLLGGGDYVAPVQRFADFVSGTKSVKSGKIKPSYFRGYEFADLNRLFPYKLAEALKSGISDMGRKMKGFDEDDAVLTAVESRTSSPIRMTRTKEMTCVGFENLYSIGEGAGYAGGITSSAVDGIKCAFEIYKKVSG